MEYSFVPRATDADGDTLTFSVQGRPQWATFNSMTGELHGTPRDADVGTTGAIVISVSDGTDSDALAGFAVDVAALAMGSADALVDSSQQQR